MKKCAYNLELKNEHGDTVLSLCDRKTKMVYRFVDAMIEDKWLGDESLMRLLIHLEKRKDYGVSVLRAAVRRDLDDSL
jgi:hypothetical protein